MRVYACVCVCMRVCVCVCAFACACACACACVYVSVECVYVHFACVRPCVCIGLYVCLCARPRVMLSLASTLYHSRPSAEYTHCRPLPVCSRNSSTGNTPVDTHTVPYCVPGNLFQ